MLGWVAAVKATELPSQLRPALIHSTWIRVSSALTAASVGIPQLSGGRLKKPPAPQESTVGPLTRRYFLGLLSPVCIVNGLPVNPESAPRVSRIRPYFDPPQGIGEPPITAPRSLLGPLRQSRPGRLASQLHSASCKSIALQAAEPAANRRSQPNQADMPSPVRALTGRTGAVGLTSWMRAM